MTSKVAHRCSATVYDPTGWGHNSSCSRNGKIEEDSKWWCKQHAPSSVKARIEASRVRWQADQDRRMAPYNEVERLRAVNAKLLAALEHVHTALDNTIGDNELLRTYLPLLVQDVSAAILAAKGD